MLPAMEAALIRRVPRVRALHVEPDGVLWAGRGRSLLHSDDDGASFERVAGFRGGWVDRLAEHSRLLARAGRAGLHACVPLADGAAVLVARKRILRREPGGDELRPVFAVPRGSRPMNLCRTPAGRLYFGEYFSNPDRDAVHVYASDDGGRTWAVAYTFPAGTIRHVHGVFHDPHRDGCWVLTGDTDAESTIRFTDDDFAHVETVFAGSQQARAVALLPGPDALWTGTDTPREQNYLQRLDPQSGRIERLQPVPGSVFGGCAAGAYKVFSVAVEPSTVNTGREASLWFSRDGETWRMLYSRERDAAQPGPGASRPRRLIGALLQHGVLVLPSGRATRPLLYAYGQALRGDDDTTLCWDLDRAWSKR